jgi:chromate reductase
MRLLALSGSLRRGSYNTGLLRAARELAPAGVEVEIWDGLAAVPPFNEDDEAKPAPPAVASLRRAIAAADGLLVATPEYNGSIPGQLKNALDWASRPFDRTPLRGKPVAVIGASTSAFGAAWAQADLRRVLATIGARVVETDLVLPFAHERFDEQGRLVDAEARARLATAVKALLDAVAARRSAAPRELVA